MSTEDALVDREEFDRKLDRLVFDAVNRTAPPVLYHYCSPDAFRGIVSTQRFWVTAHHCTNDHAELTAADSIIAEVARDMNSASLPISRRPLLRFIGEFDKMKVSRQLVIYLACFSKARDKESQWQRYADDGRGICVGLQVLAEPTPEQDLPRSIHEVEYSEEQWRRYVSAGFSSVLRGYVDYVRTHRSDEDWAASECAAALFRVAAFASICAKQPAWREEEEWRLIALAQGENAAKVERRRTSEGRDIEYVPIRVRAGGKRIAIDEVILGSRCRMAEQDVSRVLADAGYDDDMPRICRSRVVPAVP